MKRDNSLTRRQWLQTGNLGLLGLSLPRMLQMESAARAAGSPSKVKSCILLFLNGGLSHVDTWDLKPEAPAEIRGEFKPIATSLPGISICEYLPKMAALARHYSVIRSLYHQNRNHGPAGGFLLTGVNPRTDSEAGVRPKRDDPPALGALAARLAPRQQSTVPPFVILPSLQRAVGADLFRGQTAGWLGAAGDPLVIEGSGAPLAKFRTDGFVPQMDTGRLAERRLLLERLDDAAALRTPAFEAMDEYQHRAIELLTSSKGESAYDLSKEKPAVHERYGRDLLGQSCILARRLIEAGTRLVTVCSDGWDYHDKIFQNLTKKLPILDRACSALLEDLIARGLLEETVVLVVSEFGRTPKLGQSTGQAPNPTGRDHWPNCFSALMTGGNAKSGIVYGASDSKAAYPSRDPVSMEDLAPTLFAAMGLDPHAQIYAKDGRPMQVTHGQPVRELLL